MTSPQRNDPYEVDLDEVIGYIAKKRGVALSKDDPILITALINEYCFGKYDQQLRATFEQLQEALTNLVVGLDEDRDQTIEQYRELASTFLKTAIIRGDKNIDRSATRLLERIDSIAVGERHIWRRILLASLFLGVVNTVVLAILFIKALYQ